MAIGGALFELESILAVSDAARIGWWTMEWWWNQPDVPQVRAFDEAIRSRTGKAASARNWFGYAAVCTLARIANQEKSLDAVALARALQGYASVSYTHLSQSLCDTAVDLSFHDHRIDDRADIVHAPIADNARFAGAGIDFDLAEMGAV